MNDHPLSDDELVSSYLDGEATADEVARVEGDPALLARAEQLRAAATLIATPVPPPGPDRTDTMLAAALAHSTTSRDVVDLRAQAGRRERWRRPLVAAAAAVLVVGVAVPTVLAIADATRDGSDTLTASDTATIPDDDGGDSAGGAAPADTMLELDAAGADMVEAPSGVPADGGTEATPTADEALPAPEATAAAFSALPGALGPYDDIDDLVADLSAVWEAHVRKVDATEGGDAARTTTTAVLRPLPCSDAVLDHFAALDATVDLTVVEVAGRRSTVGLVDLGDATAVIVIADHGDCAVREIASLPSGP